MLLKPKLIMSTTKQYTLLAEPERRTTSLADVSGDKMTEQLLELRVKVKLLQQIGSEGRRFRVIIFGAEQTEPDQS